MSNLLKTILKTLQFIFSLDYIPKTEEEDILDLSLEKNLSRTAGSVGLPDTEAVLKSISTNHHRPVFWNLLWALLRDPSFSSILCWTDSKDLKFKILNFPFLADTWGAVKSKENMDVNNIVKVYCSILSDLQSKI